MARMWILQVGAAVLASAFMVISPAWGQTPASATPYQPKFKGDPAHSDSESQALGYMRVVLRAQREYKKRHDKFATSLSALAGTGTFSKRMAASNQRGDYTVSFHARPEPAHHGAAKSDSNSNGFILTLTPKQMDAEHRSFYAEDDGIIHGDDQKAADQDSPKVN